MKRERDGEREMPRQAPVIPVFPAEMLDTGVKMSSWTTSPVMSSDDLSPS